MKVVLIPASPLKSVLLNYPMSPHPANIRMKEGVGTIGTLGTTGTANPESTFKKSRVL
jgi:hypothetical protein